MKVRYEIETAYTYRNFANFFKTLAKKKHHFYLKHGILEGIILLGAVLAYFKWQYMDFVMMFLATAVLYPFFVSTMQKVNIRKQWRRAERNWGQKARMIFYDDYFEQIVDGKTKSYGYYELKDILESRTHFHLLITERNAITIEKADCSRELQDFIRSIEV